MAAGPRTRKLDGKCEMEKNRDREGKQTKTDGGCLINIPVRPVSAVALIILFVSVL